MPEAETLTPAQAEVVRQMTVCNACRYCEGLCAVFPAMELRRAFDGGDADYLANLCHNCGACYYDCQYAPPHEFAINVPLAMARLRDETYARNAWPAAFAGAFARHGLWVTLAAALSVALFVAGFVAANAPGALFAPVGGAGGFYRMMPHAAMAGLFGAVFLYGLAAIGFGVRKFWRATDARPVGWPEIWQACRDAASLKYLDGGGMGCMNASERPETDRRRLYHHVTFYGFVLCFAATCLATLFHEFGMAAPYPLWHPVVILGALGGVGLVAGPLGLLAQRRARDPAMGARGGMGAAFLWMLCLSGLSGMLLLGLRDTPAMGSLLALHLGVVFALFLSFPYGKFVHGFYRFAALARYAHERRTTKPQAMD